MKIVNVCHHFAPCVGGIETVVFEYAKGMKDRGAEVRVVCLNKCPNSNKVLKPKENILGIGVERLPFLDLKYYKIALGVLGKIEKADVLHLHGLNFFSDFLLFLKPLHKKKIVLSGYGGVFHTKNLGFLKKIYFYGCNKWLLGNADKVVGISQNDYALFSRIVPKSKLCLVEIGVNVEELLKIKTKKEKDSFLFVGRIAKNKRLEKLVKAFKIVAGRKKKAKLYVVGKDFDGTAKGLKELVNVLGLRENVFLLGHISKEKLRELFGKAEFFVSASRFESFGISTVEAMAAGCIPILSNIPTFKQFVCHGKNGFILDFSEVDEVGKKILEIGVLNNKNKILLSENARKEAKKYSWKNSFNKMEKIYKGLQSFQEKQQS